MTDDEIGLTFFTQNAPDRTPPKTSAFGPVDQAALIARIDSVEDDDLTSGFFDDSILDVENASTRAFDIGIRVHGTETSPALTTHGIDTHPAPEPTVVEEPVAVVDGSRAAFILGGPAGLA